jgi:hypothetical protein
MLSQNITETALLCIGQGKVNRVVINSHSSGTLKLVDGLTSGVVATTTLTSGGAMVPADYATNTITSDGTAVTDGDTVVINTTTYTAKTTLSYAGGKAYEVLIGSTADGSAFLANLKKAINASGTAGTDYGIGTAVNADVVADTLTTTTLKVWARTLGTAPNTYATTETSSHLSWADTTLGGGTGASDPGVTAAGATFTLDTTTYTGVLRLAESIGMTSVANQVLWVTSEAVFLDNIKSAVNRTGTPGTDYSLATPIHPTVFATTNANTTQVFNAKNAGTAGNSIATTETMANYSFTSTVMASGTLTASKTICNTITFSVVATTGERYIDLGGLDFSTGLLAVVGGTADLTIGFDLINQ